MATNGDIDSIQKSLVTDIVNHNSNKSSYPLNNNNYVVVFGKYTMGFSKISGIALKSSEYSAINEGGRDTPYILPEQTKKINTITFEKGLGTSNLMSIVNKINLLTIIIRGSDQSIKAVYYTDRAFVENINLSDLNANASEVLIQTMTVSYNTLKKVDNIDSLTYNPQNNKTSATSNKNNAVAILEAAKHNKVVKNR
jgi:phage tail-like protein